MSFHRSLSRFWFVTILIAVFAVGVSAPASHADDALALQGTAKAAAKKKKAKNLTTYWVSPTGDDTTGDGTEAAPFLTIARAQGAVRQNKFRAKRTITVNIEPATYTLSAPLVFGPSDSGSKKAKVIYQAAPDANAPVVISGGVLLTDFTCNLIGLLNVCTTSVPNLPAGEMPREFYVNDQRTVRARSNVGLPVNPNFALVSNGYQQTAGLPITFSKPQLLEAVTALQWKMMRCPVETQTGTTLVMQNPCWENSNTYPIPNNFLVLSWLENAPEFLTSPNMWFLDPDTQQLTFINPSLGSPQYAYLPVLETLVSLQGSPGKPVSYITFQGLQFSYATWLEPNTTDGYAEDQSGNYLKGTGYLPNTISHQQVTYKTHGNVSLQYVSNITFNSDKFIHLGGAALDFDTGSQNNTVSNNIFTDISSAAIQLGGFTPIDQRPNKFQVTSGNLISNNDISYTGQEYYDSAGIFAGFTTGTVITHNTISNTPWSALAIGWGWGLLDSPSFPGVNTGVPGMWGNYSTPTIQGSNKITSNKFQNFAQQLWDVGAIYTNGSQGTDYAHGLLIELNVAENKRPAAGSNIYYTDGGSQYVTLQQNVSINDPVGTVDFGPCGYPSSITSLCGFTGLVPYGSDIGGCLPVGNLQYIGNYFLQPTNFFGPQVCQNSYIPPFPVNLVFQNNVPTTSVADVPNWILLQAGTQEATGPAWAIPR